VEWTAWRGASDFPLYHIFLERVNKIIISEDKWRVFEGWWRNLQKWWEMQNGEQSAVKWSEVKWSEMKWSEEKTCRRSTHMNCWVALHTQIFRQHGILITEQQIGDINPPLWTCEYNKYPSTQPIASFLLLSIRRTPSHCSTTHSHATW